MSKKVENKSHRLLCVESGSLTARFPDRLIFIPATYGLWIANGETFTRKLSPKGTVREISLHLSDLPPHLSRAASVSLSPLASALVAHIASLRAPAVERQRAEVVLADLLKPTSSVYEIPLPTEPRFLRAAEDVLRNPTGLHRLIDHAPVAGVSSQTFAKSFKAHVGTPWVDWRLAAKMYYAASLLNEGTSVSDVSYTMKYKGPSTFGVAFSRFFGANAGVFKNHAVCGSCGRKKHRRTPSTIHSEAAHT